MSEMDSAPENILPMPWQNNLTRDLRREATKQNRAEFLSLWAGQGTRMARRQSAAELIVQLANEARESLRRLESMLN